MNIIDDFLKQLYNDNRTQAKEWRGSNIPYGDDSNRPNLIRKCMTMEGNRQKINCLRKLRDQAAMNPFYQARLDRFVDAITGIYEPTDEQGTIPGNEFKSGNVGEDLVESYLNEFWGKKPIPKPEVKPEVKPHSIVKYKGKTFKVDEKGYLLNPNNYSAVWVEYACKKVGIKKVTPDHMKVIKVTRSYYTKNEVFPMILVITKVTGFNLKTLYTLFPNGPTSSLGLIIGMPYSQVERLLR